MIKEQCTRLWYKRELGPPDTEHPRMWRSKVQLSLSQLGIAYNESWLLKVARIVSIHFSFTYEKTME